MSKRKDKKVLHLTDASEEEAMNSMIRAGPLTIVLVYSNTCPHCHTYMPLWKELCAMKDKRANLVSMEAATYQGTTMSEKKAIDGVPTVLFVDKEGTITEAESPRNKTVMTNAVRMGLTEKEASAEPTVAEPTVAEPTVAEPTVAEPTVATPTLSASSEIFTPVSEVASEPSSIPVPTAVPGVTVSPSELRALPGTPIPSSQTGGAQIGGNPWAAFLIAARQAAPAAVLLGAYTLTRRRRTTRASGLGRSRRRRVTRRKSNKGRK